MQAAEAESRRIRSCQADPDKARGPLRHRQDAHQRQARRQGARIDTVPADLKPRFGKEFGRAVLQAADQPGLGGGQFDADIIAARHQAQFAAPDKQAQRLGSFHKRHVPGGGAGLQGRRSRARGHGNDAGIPVVAQMRHGAPLSIIAIFIY